MALSVSVGTFETTTGAATSIVTISGLAFDPSAATSVVEFWWNGTTSAADQITGGDLQFGYGAGYSTASRWYITGTAQDGAAASWPTSRADGTNACVVITTVGSTSADGALDFNAWTSDGFELIVDNQFTNSHIINYRVLTGMTNVFLGTITGTASIGTVEETCGFAPDYVKQVNSSDVDIAADAHLMIGMVDSSATTNQANVGISIQDGGAHVYHGYQGEWLHGQKASGAVDPRSVFLSTTATGFIHDWVEAESVFGVKYIALAGGGQYAARVLTTATSTGTTQESAAGFQPITVMLASAGTAATAQDTNDATHDVMMSIGATDGTNHGVMGIAAVNGADPSNAQRFHDKDLVYQRSGFADDVVGAIAHDSFNATGWVWNQSDADPAPAAFAIYEAIGQEASGTTIPNMLGAIVQTLQSFGVSN